MRFQFKEPRRCLTGTSHFTFPAARTHEKLLSWKCYGTEAPVVVIEDPILTRAEEHELFSRQKSFKFVQPEEAMKLVELEFEEKGTGYDYSDLI